MKTRLSLLACALTVLALAAPPPAQDPPATLTVGGTITSSSPTSLVIRADDGSQKTFVVDDRSTIPTALARGARVTVTYETSGSQMRAVSVSSSDTQPPSTTSGTEPMATEPGRRLPATASPLPLMALMSALAMGCGFALRTYGRRLN